MHNPNTGFNLEATKVRLWFADKLKETAEIIAQSEQQATNTGASGELALSAFVKDLDQEIERLKNGKFRFLIIGDFNRGKSTILNAFFEQSLLPIGVTATTALPTFIKYGKQKQVVVHKTDGTEESLNLEEYKKQYTLNSKEVKDQIKNEFNSVRDWLNPLDYAEFYCPIEVLSRGVEFIDTAGLNHTEEENQKTFSYIQECHAILFVLAADQQFTQQEQDYLKKLLRIKKGIENSENQPQLIQSESAPPTSKNTKQVRPIFYLINKWENVEKNDKKEIHETFIATFCECLGVHEDEAVKMWGDTVFDIYAKTALENLEQGKSLDGTGLREFQERLNHFLTNERLITELLQTFKIAKTAATKVDLQVNDRFRVLEDDVKILEEKIKKTKPCIDVMKKNVQFLEKEVKSARDSCIEKVAGQYQEYFDQLVINFEKEFQMPPVFDLKDNQREEYIQNLEKKLTEYQQDKLDNWHKISNGIVSDAINALRDSFPKEIDDYIQQRDTIGEILDQGSFNAGNQTGVSIAQSSSSRASAMGTMILGATGIYLCTDIGVIGAGLALTPVGWALLGGSVVVGGVVAWWQRRTEVQKFQEKMQAEVKEALKKLLEKDKVEALKGQVGKLFTPYDDLAKLMREDVKSLETSLENLLELKKTSEINCELEKERLKTFVANILGQFTTIEAKYNEIAKVQPEES